MLWNQALLKLYRGYSFFVKNQKLVVYGTRFHSTISRMDNVIGIDLGSMNARAAIIMAGQAPIIIESESGNEMPTYVADTDEGILVGRSARVHGLYYPKDVFFNISHLIGRRFDDPHIQKLMTVVPYKVVAGPNGEAIVETRNREFTPRKLLSIVFGRIKMYAEIYTMRRNFKTVISVPGYFNDAQMKETGLAARDAGFDVHDVTINPISVACYHTGMRKDGIVGVYSFGGQFNFSVLEITDGVVKVKSQSSDPFLGGRDFDTAIFNYVMEEVKRVYKVDLSQDRAARMRLMVLAERAKHELSIKEETVIDVSYMDAELKKDGFIPLSFKMFEKLVTHLVERTTLHCSNALLEAGISIGQLDEVILIGGLTKVPIVQRIVEENFGKSTTLRRDLGGAVASGAALQCAFIIENKRELPPGILPLSIGFEDSEGGFRKVIERGTVLPARGRAEIYSSIHGQRSFCIRVFQGEHKKASRNFLLGEFDLLGMPMLPAGGVSFGLILDISRNGTITVSSQNDGICRSVNEVFKLQMLCEKEIRRAVKDAILGELECDEFLSRKLAREVKLETGRLEMITKLKEFLKYYDTSSYYDVTSKPHELQSALLFRQLV